MERIVVGDALRRGEGFGADDDHAGTGGLALAVHERPGGEQDALPFDFNPIQIPLDPGILDTGMEKLGAVIGDNVELGCNAIVCPGTLIGKDVWIYPGMTVPKGYYPAGTLLVPKDRKPRSTRK